MLLVLVWFTGGALLICSWSALGPLLVCSRFARGCGAVRFAMVWLVPHPLFKKMGMCVTPEFAHCYFVSMIMIARITITSLAVLGPTDSHESKVSLDMGNVI